MITHKEKNLTLEQRLKEFELRLRNELTLGMGSSTPRAGENKAGEFFPITEQESESNLVTLSAGR